MKFSISNLPFLGYEINRMKDFPADIGIEVFAEFGNLYYWRYCLPRILDLRTGPFSVHGPFCNFDLASADCNFEDIKEHFKLSFNLCVDYGAQHCVCHTSEVKHGYSGDFIVEDGEKLSRERIKVLGELAEQQGVRLLVENLAYPDILFQQPAFTDTFNQLENVDCLVDIGHAIVRHWDLSKLMSDLGSRIRAFHVHDNDGISDSHLKAGDGILDWVQFFRDYHAYCPDAVLVLEYMSGTVHGLMESIEFLKSCSVRAS